MKSRLKSHTFFMFYGALIICSGLLGCASASSELKSNKPAEIYSKRIIVGFSSADIDPQNPDVIKTIGDTLNAKLMFTRKLSGNAAVYSAEMQHTDDIAIKLAALKQIEYIRYAELDQRVHIQTQQ